MPARNSCVLVTMSIGTYAKLQTSLGGSVRALNYLILRVFFASILILHYSSPKLETSAKVVTLVAQHVFRL